MASNGTSLRDLPAVRRAPQCFAIGLMVMAAISFPARTGLADSAGVVGANNFAAKDGKTLYATICQGCHMPNGKGAVGAGAYPALASNKNLESAGYPIYLVLYGQKAMPGFGGFLDDDQVAAVVNYVRSNFGNSYTDKVSGDDVKSNRQPNAIYSTLD
ncbi:MULTISPECIES: cytochrome c [Bradyrhizobium]|jgi:mono/diheme cytochrome c family protein|uniref:c-type cytochrome n=1 Tax=Bradyrhizobium TaxID=374 RepID=UPI0004155023|nr:MULTISPECIES: cytochrome c [Bradyrhizobium]MBK5656826.1 cytochrome c [Rhizobium sp.]